MLRASRKARRAGVGAPGAGTGPDQEDELRAVVGVMVQQRTQRRRALALVRAFFEDPVRFVMRTEVAQVPEARADRERRLRDRLELLRVLLDLMEGEMQLLSKVQVDGRASEEAAPEPAPPTATSRSARTS